ncbi:MAG: hypothetical protein AB8E82_06320 [Aureispira sp.]
MQQAWREGSSQQQFSLRGIPTGLLWVELRGANFQPTLSLMKQ